MRRNRTLTHRLSFNLSTLVAAGAVSLLGLSSAERASGLAGDVGASYTQTVTPRESSGAAGGATFIRTSAASVSSSNTAAASQQTGTMEEGSSSSSSGRKRTASREEGSGTRRKSAKSKSASSGDTSSGKNVVASSKDKVVLAAPTVNKPVFSLSSGFETRYIYHGLDIISFNSKVGNLSTVLRDPALNPKDSSGITYTNADMSFMGAHVDLGYIRALSPTYPFFQAPSLDSFGGKPAKGNIGNEIAIGSGFLDQQGNPLPPNHKRFYQEVDLNFDYTLSIVQGILDTTLGYNSYFFAYHDFKGTSYQGEAFARLSYKQLKYVVPSFTYYYNVSSYDQNEGSGNLNGSYTEFRIDGALPLINKAYIGVTFAPYVAAGYNINYLKYGDGNVGGWNDLEAGVKLPIRLGKYFTITPYGNYGLNLSDNTQAINSLTTSRLLTNFNSKGFPTSAGYNEQTRFWGGVTVALSF